MVFTTARHKHALAAGAALAAAVLPVMSVPASASSHPAVPASPVTASPGTASPGTASPGTGRQVSYRGYHFQVPAGWPVVDLHSHPATCVRFDRHAFYLGDPGANPSCPSGLVGATEAVLIQPAGAHRA